MPTPLPITTRYRWRLLLALVVLVIAAWFARRGFEVRPPPAPDSESVALPTEPVTASEAPEEVGPEVTPPPDLLAGDPIDPGPAPAEGLCAVRVVDRGGEPIAGVQVTSIRASSMTDVRGIAWIPPVRGDMGMPSNDRYARTVKITAPGYVTVNIKSENRRPCETVRLTRRGAVLSGECVDTSGEPVAGATLRTDGNWWNPGVELLTDAEGRFTTNRAPRRELRLGMGPGPWLSAEVRVVPPETGVVVTAVRPARLEGRITLPTGSGEPFFSPARGLRISPDRPHRLHFKRDGSFVLDCLPGPTELIYSRVTLDRFLLREGAVRRDLEYPKPEPRPVAARPPEPSPPPSPATVFLTTPRMKSTCSLVAGFANGEVLILDRKFISHGDPVAVGLPREDLRWVGLGGYRGVDQVEVARGSTRVYIPREAAGEMVATAVDAKGRPVREGELGLRWPGSRRLAISSPLGRGPRPPGAETVEGRVLIPNVGPGRYDLVWSSRVLREHVVLRRNVRMPEPPERRDLGTVVIAAVPFTLRVLVTGPDGRPIPGAVVTLEAAYPATAGRTDARGLFEHALYDPTTLRIRVAAPGYEDARARTRTDAPGEVVTIRLKRE